MKYVIAYDLGTGGTKASLFDETGKTIAASFEGCKTYYPKEGYHEQCPADWWKIVKVSTMNLINQVDIDIRDIVSIGLSGHSLGVVPLNENGQLLIDQVPIWSDSRAEEESKEFFDTINEEEWYLTTGNGFPAPLYSIFKIMWYKNNMKDLYNDTYKFIGTKDYINYKMTNRMVTDFSYASGSGVYNLKKWKYEDDFINASKINKEKLPQIYSSDYVLGNLTEEAASELNLHTEVKVVCGGVDNACMALGAGCIEDGMAYTSLGTSAWIAVSSKEPIVEPVKKPYVFTHCIPNKFVSATCIFSAGSSLKWVRDNICSHLVESEKITGLDAFEEMIKLSEESVLGANKLMFNPSLAGGSSLDKSTNVKGAFIGLTLGHNTSDLIRATLEGICLNLRIALDVLRDNVEFSDSMLIVGGGSKSEVWRTLFADIYGMNIIQTNVGQNAGSLGAAALALVGSGLWDNYTKLERIHRVLNNIDPEDERKEKYNRILEVFKKVCDIQSDIGDMLSQL